MSTGLVTVLNNNVSCGSRGFANGSQCQLAKVYNCPNDDDLQFLFAIHSRPDRVRGQSYCSQASEGQTRLKRQIKATPMSPRTPGRAIRCSKWPGEVQAEVWIGSLPTPRTEQIRSTSGMLPVAPLVCYCGLLTILTSTVAAASAYRVSVLVLVRSRMRWHGTGLPIRRRAASTKWSCFQALSWLTSIKAAR